MSIGYSTHRKKQESAEIERQTKEFLASGGIIQKFTSDQHTYDPLKNTFMTRDKLRAKKVKDANDNA